MTNKQQGFTLIELVAVIVILGALAVVALPRFINLQDEAQAAALSGVAGGLESAAAVNLAGALASDTTGDVVSVNACGDLPNALQGGLDSPYAMSAFTDASGATNLGDPFTCGVGNGSSTVSVQAYRVP